MTKEQYLRDVQTQNFPNILYAMYLEKFDGNKHKPFLQPREFMTYIQMTGMMNEYLQNTFSHYDQKFNINRLYNKEGKLIRLL